MTNCTKVSTGQLYRNRKVSAKISKTIPTFGEAYEIIADIVDGKYKSVTPNPKRRAGKRASENSVYLNITSELEIYLGESDDADHRAYQHKHNSKDCLYKKDFITYIATYCPKIYYRDDRHACETVFILAAQAFCENNPEYTLLNKNKIEKETFAHERFSVQDLNKIAAIEKAREVVA